eukprot:g4409.t1
MEPVVSASDGAAPLDGSHHEIEEEGNLHPQPKLHFTHILDIVKGAPEYGRGTAHIFSDESKKPISICKSGRDDSIQWHMVPGFTAGIGRGYAKRFIVVSRDADLGDPSIGYDGFKIGVFKDKHFKQPAKNTPIIFVNIDYSPLKINDLFGSVPTESDPKNKRAFQSFVQDCDDECPHGPSFANYACNNHQFCVDFLGGASRGHPGDRVWTFCFQSSDHRERFWDLFGGYVEQTAFDRTNNQTRAVATDPTKRLQMEIMQAATLAEEKRQRDEQKVIELIEKKKKNIVIQQSGEISVEESEDDTIDGDLLDCSDAKEANDTEGLYHVGEYVVDSDGNQWQVAKRNEHGATMRKDGFYTYDLKSRDDSHSHLSDSSSSVASKSSVSSVYPQQNARFDVPARMLVLDEESVNGRKFSAYQRAEQFVQKTARKGRNAHHFFTITGQRGQASVVSFKDLEDIKFFAGFNFHIGQLPIKILKEVSDNLDHANEAREMTLTILKDASNAIIVESEAEKQEEEIFLSESPEDEKIIIWPRGDECPQNAKDNLATIEFSLEKLKTYIEISADHSIMTDWADWIASIDGDFDVLVTFGLHARFIRVFDKSTEKGYRWIARKKDFQLCLDKYEIKIDKARKPLFFWTSDDFSSSFRSALYSFVFGMVDKGEDIKMPDEAWLHAPVQTSLTTLNHFVPAMLHSWVNEKAKVAVRKIISCMLMENEDIFSGIMDSQIIAQQNAKTNKDYLLQEFTIAAEAKINIDTSVDTENLFQIKSNVDAKLLVDPVLRSIIPRLGLGLGDNGEIVDLDHPEVSRDDIPITRILKMWISKHGKSGLFSVTNSKLPEEEAVRVDFTPVLINIIDLIESGSTTFSGYLNKLKLSFIRNGIDVGADDDSSITKPDLQMKLCHSDASFTIPTYDKEQMIRLHMLMLKDFLLGFDFDQNASRIQQRDEYGKLRAFGEQYDVNDDANVAAVGGVINANFHNVLFETKLSESIYMLYRFFDEKYRQHEKYALAIELEEYFIPFIREYCERKGLDENCGQDLLSGIHFHLQTGVGAFDEICESRKNEIEMEQESGLSYNSETGTFRIAGEMFAKGPDDLVLLVEVALQLASFLHKKYKNEILNGNFEIPEVFREAMRAREEAARKRVVEFTGEKGPVSNQSAPNENIGVREANRLNAGDENDSKVEMERPTDSVFGEKENVKEAELVPKVFLEEHANVNVSHLHSKPSPYRSTFVKKEEVEENGPLCIPLPPKVPEGCTEEFTGTVVIQQMGPSHREWLSKYLFTTKDAESASQFLQILHCNSSLETKNFRDVQLRWSETSDKVTMLQEYDTTLLQLCSESQTMQSNPYTFIVCVKRHDGDEEEGRITIDVAPTTLGRGQSPITLLKAFNALYGADDDVQNVLRLAELGENEDNDLTMKLMQGTWYEDIVKQWIRELNVESLNVESRFKLIQEIAIPDLPSMVIAADEFDLDIQMKVNVDFRMPNESKMRQLKMGQLSKAENDFMFSSHANRSQYLPEFIREMKSNGNNYPFPRAVLWIGHHSHDLGVYKHDKERLDTKIEEYTSLIKDCNHSNGEDAEGPFAKVSGEANQFGFAMNETIESSPVQILLNKLKFQDVMFGFIAQAFYLPSQNNQNVGEWVIMDELMDTCLPVTSSLLSTLEVELSPVKGNRWLNFKVGTALTAANLFSNFKFLRNKITDAISWRIKNQVFCAVNKIFNPPLQIGEKVEIVGQFVEKGDYFTPIGRVGVVTKIERGVKDFHDVFASILQRYHNEVPETSPKTQLATFQDPSICWDHGIGFDKDRGTRYCPTISKGSKKLDCQYSDHWKRCRPKWFREGKWSKSSKSLRFAWEVLRLSHKYGNTNPLSLFCKKNKFQYNCLDEGEETTRNLLIGFQKSWDLTQNAATVALYGLSSGENELWTGTGFYDMDRQASSSLDVATAKDDFSQHIFVYFEKEEKEEIFPLSYLQRPSKFRELMVYGIDYFRFQLNIRSQENIFSVSTNADVEENLEKFNESGQFAKIFENFQKQRAKTNIERETSDDNLDLEEDAEVPSSLSPETASFSDAAPDQERTFWDFIVKPQLSGTGSLNMENVEIMAPLTINQLFRLVTMKAKQSYYNALSKLQ